MDYLKQLLLLVDFGFFNSANTTAAYLLVGGFSHCKLSLHLL